MRTILFLLCLSFCICITAQDKNATDQMNIEQLRNAADDDNDTNAQYQLALMYLSGNKVKKDSACAAEYLLHSAAGGFLTPHLIFGNYQAQSANAKAKSKLLELCKLEGSNHLHYFLTLTGCLYFASQDYPMAEQYFKEAIKKGNILAEVELGMMYFYIAVNSPTPVNGGKAKDEEDEEFFIMESWKMSNNSLALHYLDNKKWSEKDNGAYWLEDAVNHEFGDFEFGVMSYTIYDHLIFAYTAGIGVPQNMEKTIITACTCLKDEDVENFLQAQGALENAIEEPTLIWKPFLQSQLNILYDFTFEKNTARKKEVNALSAYYIGILHKKREEYKTAFMYLSEAAELGNEQAMLQLAECYGKGKGTAVNKAKEKYWEEKAKKTDE